MSLDEFCFFMSAALESLFGLELTAERPRCLKNNGDIEEIEVVYKEC